MDISATLIGRLALGRLEPGAIGSPYAGVCADPFVLGGVDLSNRAWVGMISVDRDVLYREC